MSDGVSAETLTSISTPDVVESRLGRLEFRDGAPSQATSALLYDNLDFMHGVEAFINSFPAASVGIVKGQPFDPDERMRKILSEAIEVGNGTARTVAFDPRDREGWPYYPGSTWFNMLFEGGYEFLTPPPEITANGVEQLPSDGARKTNSRIAMFYPYTLITPAMCMRLTGIGSRYLISMHGGDGEFLDGDRNYRIALPPDVPESRFWSVILYDNQTRSMLQTDQPMPNLGSQTGTVKTSPDGSTDVYIGPTAPDGKEANWLQTVPGKGFFRYRASVTHSSRSSTRPGGRAKSNRWTDEHRPGRKTASDRKEAAWPR